MNEEEGTDYINANYIPVSKRQYNIFLKPGIQILAQPERTIPTVVKKAILYLATRLRNSSHQSSSE